MPVLRRSARTVSPRTGRYFGLVALQPGSMVSNALLPDTCGGRSLASAAKPDLGAVLLLQQSRIHGDGYPALMGHRPEPVAMT